jgi:hypothetical protein
MPSCAIVSAGSGSAGLTTDSSATLGIDQVKTVTVNHATQAGLLAVLCGVAVACVAAIVVVVRAPMSQTHQHELLPVNSETVSV